MAKLKNNYAFIDGSNLYLSVRDLGWELDYTKFRVYLREKYGVEKAYLFLGYVSTNEDLYKALQEYGFILILKPTIPNKEGELKGNIDADLVLQCMIDFEKYQKAIIVSGDGDFYSLTRYLYSKDKLLRVIAPNKEESSVLLRKEARGLIMFIDDLRRKLEYKKKSTA